MGLRLDLQTLLEGILGTGNVYFQPPETVKLVYPCIIYSRNSGDVDFADNINYRHYIQYDVMVIDKNPDSEILSKIAALPLCKYSRHYTLNNLNHDVFTLYY